MNVEEHDVKRIHCAYCGGYIGLYRKGARRMARAVYCDLHCATMHDDEVERIAIAKKEPS